MASDDKLLGGACSQLDRLRLILGGLGSLQVGARRLRPAPGLGKRRRQLPVEGPVRLAARRRPGQRHAIPMGGSFEGQRRRCCVARLDRVPSGSRGLAAGFQVTCDGFGVRVAFDLERFRQRSVQGPQTFLVQRGHQRLAHTIVIALQQLDAGPVLGEHDALVAEL